MQRSRLIFILLCAIPSCSPSGDSLAPAAPAPPPHPPLACKPPPPSPQLQPQTGLAGSTSGSPGTPPTPGPQAASTPPAVTVARPRRRVRGKPQQPKITAPRVGPGIREAVKAPDIGAGRPGKSERAVAAKPKLEFFMGGTMSLTEVELRGVIEDQFGPLTGEAHTVTPSHRDTVTPSHLHTVTPSHPHTLSPSHPHTLTPSQPHTLIPPAPVSSQNSAGPQSEWIAAQACWPIERPPPRMVQMLARAADTGHSN